jgi:hypothetical protein
VVTAKDILETLSSQKFYDWYEKDFAEYIQGGEDCKSKIQTLHDICQLFDVPMKVKED